jgi:hypothetical protein
VIKAFYDNRNFNLNKYLYIFYLFCVYIDKCIFIIVKIKYINFNKINNIYDKINFIINYTYFIIFDNILSKNI